MAAFGCPPWVFKVVSLALKGCCLHRARMPVTRQNAGFAHAQEVDEVAMRNVEHQRPEPHVLLTC